MCSLSRTRRERGARSSLRERVYWHPVDDSTVYDAVQKGIAGSMPALSLPDDQAWQVVAYVRALTAPAIETPLTDGDPRAGEELFWGRGGCGSCHRIRGRGGFLGPDLTNVGTTRSLPQIREAILDPDAGGSRDYRAVDTLLKSGMRLKGVVRDHTNYSLALQDQDGNMHLIFMKDVSELSIAKSSPMPKDYKQRLRSRDVEDMLAFLGRQSIREVTRTKSPE